MSDIDYDIDLLTNDEMVDDVIDDEPIDDFFSQPVRDHRHPHHHHQHCPPIASDRINAFLNIKNQPYLLNEYLEDIVFKQIDQAFITNSFSISNSELDRTVVDVSIDDTKPILGNRIKYSRLIEAVFKSVCANRHNILPVIKKSLIVQVNYQLENQRTGEVLKQCVEKLDIKTRDYFVDINVRSISDNAIDNSILTNFSDVLTNVVAEFLHGSESMICRITEISLYYPAVLTRKHHPNHNPNIDPRGPVQHHHSNHPNGHHHDCDHYQYNWYYHFDNHAKNIHLHEDRIDDMHNEIIMVPLRTIKFDKTFPVNTGHVITFNFSVWRSDVIMVKNCRRIAEILGGSPHRKVHKTIEDILDRLDAIKQTNYEQDTKLDSITAKLDNMMSEDQALELSSNIISSYGSNSSE